MTFLDMMRFTIAMNLGILLYKYMFGLPRPQKIFDTKSKYFTVQPCHYLPLSTVAEDYLSLPPHTSGTQQSSLDHMQVHRWGCYFLWPGTFDIVQLKFDMITARSNNHEIGRWGNWERTMPHTIASHQVTLDCLQFHLLAAPNVVPASFLLYWFIVVEHV